VNRLKEEQKDMRRFFVLALSLFLIFSLLPAVVFAEGQEVDLTEGDVPPVEDTTTPKIVDRTSEVYKDGVPVYLWYSEDITTGYIPSFTFLKRSVEELDGI